MLTEKDLRDGLKSRTIGTKIYSFGTIDSTNSCAKALAGCWALEGTVVIAEQQTAGRGRLGRSWEATSGENLTFSVILRPSLTPEAVNLLPLMTAVAVAQATRTIAKTEVECKWPNDLLSGGKKFAGILLEGSIKEKAVEFVVLGIGVNVNQTAFPPGLKDRATSLKLISGRDVSREELFREILLRLESLYVEIKKSGPDSIIPLWLSLSSMMGRKISVDQHGTVLHGTVAGLAPDGALLLRANGSDTALFAGDVTILGMDQRIGGNAARH